MSNNPITIGICAPSSSFDKEDFEKSVAYLNSLGFKTVFSDAIFEKKDYLAGSDELRARELNALFANKNVDVIMCARGGYGASRIIERLDTDLIMSGKKVFIGASDICSILFYLEKSSNKDPLEADTSRRLFLGPFVIEMKSDMDKDSLDLFLKVIREDTVSHTITGLTTLVSGQVKANVTGGCLSIIEASLKTSYEIETDGKILFIEDVAEPLYRIDRMLTHLKNAGKFKNIKGVMAGSFTKSDFSEDRFNALLTDIFKEYDVPIVTGFPAGHGKKRYLIPLKRNVILDADKGCVKYSDV
jgi:muramoyltetrapeptide carboxypeptidase